MSLKNDSDFRSGCASEGKTAKYCNVALSDIGILCQDLPAASEG